MKNERLIPIILTMAILFVIVNIYYTGLKGEVLRNEHIGYSSCRTAECIKNTFDTLNRGGDKEGMRELASKLKAIK